MNKCIFKYYGTPPTDKSILISCSIFKLRKMYDKIDVYTSGLLRLIKFILQLDNYHLLIYYDKSIIDNTRFNDILKQYKNNKCIYFCEYICPPYYDKYKFHKNVFGMYMRLIPLFDKNIKYQCLYISDIDYLYKELLFLVDSNIHNFIKSDYQYACNYKIGYEWKYNLLFNIPNSTISVLSNIYTKKHISSLNYLFDFLDKLNNNDIKLKSCHDKLIEYKNKKNRKGYIKYKCIIKSEYTKYLDKDIDLFSYGFDEFFTNAYIMPILMDIDKGEIGVYYRYDVICKYTTNIVDYKLLPKGIKDNYINSIVKCNKYVTFNKKLETLQSILKLDKIYNKDKSTFDLLLRFEDVKLLYIEHTLLLYKNNKKYFTGNYYEEYLRNLVLHKHKGIHISLLFKNIDKKTVEYIKNIDIYPFQELLEIKALKFE